MHILYLIIYLTLSPPPALWNDYIYINQDSPILQHSKFKAYLFECKKREIHPTLIVGCGYNSKRDFNDGQTVMCGHKHKGRNFYIDINPKVEPDIVFNFLEISSDVIPDHTFSIVYFETMADAMRHESVLSQFLQVAHRILKANGTLFYNHTSEHNIDYQGFTKNSEILRQNNFALPEQIDLKFTNHPFNDKQERALSNPHSLSTSYKELLFKAVKIDT